MAELVLACVGVNNYQAMFDKLRGLESSEPQWRQKTNLVWLLEGEQMHSPVVPEEDEICSFVFKVSPSEREPRPNQLRDYGDRYPISTLNCLS